MKKIKIWKIMLIVLGLFVIVFAIFFFANMPKQLHIDVSSYDLSAIDDGVYTGVCENGLVSVELEVSVKNHAIANINIIKHQNGLGAKAESIIDEVVQQQSLEIDAIAGATMSSQTILKAIENALKVAGEN
jgi:uncharacterized protein with FMN-binding domain